jgi:protein-histidine pros-kinase
VPAYAATETLALLPEQYHEYAFKEATLNPTNPRDRASDWEADLVQAFKSDRSLKTLNGVRQTPNGPSLYIASPLTISNEACLTCHSTPARAPPTMLALYGDSNGFGWKLNEVVGAQVVSVPMSVAVANANRAFVTFMASICVVFLVLYVVLNLMLSRIIVKPIADMSRAADEISTGNFDIPELQEKGKDEIGRLAISFNRMRRSLEQAIKMIEK